MPIRAAARPEPEEHPREVFVRDLVVPCLIGIYDAEKEAPQRVRFTVGLAVRASAPSPSPSGLQEQVIAGIRALVGDGHVNLVETLAERVAALCLQCPDVLSARVRVEKLDIFEDAEAVGIEIERLNTPALGFPAGTSQGSGGVY